MLLRKRRTHKGRTCGAPGIRIRLRHSYSRLSLLDADQDARAAQAPGVGTNRGLAEVAWSCFSET